MEWKSARGRRRSASQAEVTRVYACFGPHVPTELRTVVTGKILAEQFL